MTCRHPAGYHDNDYLTSPPAPAKPDAEKYVIEAVQRIGQHLVMKVRYPNCVLCAFEGVKVMVFLNVSETQALMWRRIDPHFRAPMKALPSHAPSPAARFPADAEGWADAVEYARTKSKPPF
jgi:hypothetical protein